MAFELIRVAALLLAFCYEGMRFLRELRKTPENAAPSDFCWKGAVIRILIILLAMGGPVHYFCQLLHETGMVA
jgi:hypothetical protein